MSNIDSLAEFGDTKLELAPKFEERKGVDKKHIQETRSSNRTENWAIGQGDYFMPFNRDQELVFPPRTDQSELLGTEVVLYGVMIKAIEERQRMSVPGPAVFLDFGGMWGASWARLANKFRAEISSGKACFVVSNISLNPKVDAIDPRSYDEGTIKTVDAYKSLVTYVKADASELKSTKVALPSGEEVPLDKHLSLIHESAALMHGSIPDVDLPTLATTLEPRGILMFSSRMMHSNIPEREALKNEINGAFRLGETNLEKIGMKKLNIPNESYKIYSSTDNSKSLFL